MLRTGRPVVLDADALTSFGDAFKELIGSLHSQTVLTPHEGELARIYPDLARHNDKLGRARQAAKASNATLLLKGPDSVIAAPDGTALINANAPAGLATGGTGDVLAGMIAGLLAQGLGGLAAAAAGAFVHGAAAQKCGLSLIAEDIEGYISSVTKEISEK
jgi:NAD(P)H-hydrate epimerase